jgi:hypothetical protein
MESISKRYLTQWSYRRETKRLERSGWRIVDEVREPWISGPVYVWADNGIISLPILIIRLVRKVFPFFRRFRLVMTTVRYER